MRNIQQEVEVTRNHMAGFGYRPIKKEDITPGREALMVKVEDFFLSTKRDGIAPHLRPSTTQIRIDDEAMKVTGHRANDEPTVYYHCIMPHWDSDCFVGLNDFTRDGYADSAPYANDTRYFVKS